MWAVCRFIKSGRFTKLCDHFTPPQNVAYTERDDHIVSKGPLSSVRQQEYHCTTGVSADTYILCLRRQIRAKGTFSLESYLTFLEDALHTWLPPVMQVTPRGLLGTWGMRGGEGVCTVPEP